MVSGKYKGDELFFALTEYGGTYRAVGEACGRCKFPLVRGPPADGRTSRVVCWSASARVCGPTESDLREPTVSRGFDAAEQCFEEALRRFAQRMIRNARNGYSGQTIVCPNRCVGESRRRSGLLVHGTEKQTVGDQGRRADRRVARFIGLNLTAWVAPKIGVTLHGIRCDRSGSG